MICEKCGRETDTLVLVPIRQADGKLEPICCEVCAPSSDVYCRIHDRYHTGFTDGTHACIECVEDAVQVHGQQYGHKLLDRIDNASDQWQPLFEWAEMVMEVTNESYEMIVGRAIICLAIRQGLAYNDVTHRALGQGPDYLLGF